MKKASFSWLALGIGGTIAMVLLRFGSPGPDGGPLLPLLTSLFMAEFGFLVTAVGAWFGYRAWSTDRSALMTLLSPVACTLLALGFAWLGLAIWSGRVAVG